MYDVSVKAIAGRGYPPTPDPEARRWPWVVVGVIASIPMVAYVAGLVRIEQRRRAEHRIG